ncbi:MAG: hypothetical protein ABIR11_11545 [Candidatus Limnocylindrales bacterium]
MIELLLQAERALSMGMLDQAERTYRQASAADPRNSIAVVGLARVALERADDVGAWREARRALTIDPENAAALRLVERLEEVWRYRGQAMPEEIAAPVAAVAPSVPSAPAGQVVAAASASAVPPAPQRAPDTASTHAEPSKDPQAGVDPAPPQPAPASASTHIEPSNDPAAPSNEPAAPSNDPAAAGRGLVDRLLGRNRA